MKKKGFRIAVILSVFLILAGIVVIKKDVLRRLRFHDWNLEADAGFVPEEVLNQGYPVMLDIGTSWCNPCRMMHPVLEETAEELKNKAIIRYLEVDTYPELQPLYPTPYYPTQYFFDADGNPYGYHYGYLDKDAIYEIFAEMGYDFR